MKINIGSDKNHLVVIPVFENNKKVTFFQNLKSNLSEKLILETIHLFNFKAENLSTLFFNINKQKVLLIALKKDYNLEDLRRAYSNVFNLLKSKKEESALVFIPKEKEEEIVAVIEGLNLSDYSFNKYISKKEKYDLEINLDISKKFENILKESLIVNKNVIFAREIVNENSNIQTPIEFEKQAKEFAKKNKLKINVLDEKQIKKEKLNLLLAVGQGSQNPPRLIIVEYIGDKTSKEKIALVGKGITFDTGGINLKPTGYLEDMKSDMGGAATVFAVFKSAVELKLKKNLILVMSCAENSISSKSYNPGDIFISHKGISVEIGNTDAEGRLVLADALSYVQKYYKPSQIIDMATLTGACLVALGPSLIAMLGNDKKINQKIFESGEKTFERVWELPIYEEHRDLIKSKFADIKNIGGKDGGTITAAAFLEKFIDKNIKWTHLDIAGAARSHKIDYYITEFGTGRGVRLLVDYLKY